jgi:uncharacterized protein (DUF2141 family)
MKPTAFAVATLLSLIAGAACADPAKLIVTVTSVRSAAGDLRVSLYSDPETFRKEERAVKVIVIPASPGETTVEFADLPPGRYAVMTYHDENGDGKLNLRLGMFPTEGYALSNAPQVMGPPRFGDSAFAVSDPETRIAMTLSY